MIEIQANDEFNEIMKYNTHVIAFFYTHWASICSVAEEKILALKPKYQEKVEFVKIDCDNLPELAEKYNIDIKPTILLMYDSKEEMRCVGPNGYQLEKMMKYREGEKKKRITVKRTGISQQRKPTPILKNRESSPSMFGKQKQTKGKDLKNLREEREKRELRMQNKLKNDESGNVEEIENEGAMMKITEFLKKIDFKMVLIWGILILMIIGILYYFLSVYIKMGPMMNEMTWYEAMKQRANNPQRLRRN